MNDSPSKVIFESEHEVVTEPRAEGLSFSGQPARFSNFKVLHLVDENWPEKALSSCKCETS